ncbi:hypothetical protein ABEX38_30150 [Priestia megaterium]
MNEIPMELRVLMETLEAKNESLQKENDELKAQNDFLVKDTEMLQEITDDLEKEVQELENCIADLEYVLSNPDTFKISEINLPVTDLIEMQMPDGTVLKMSYDNYMKFIQANGGL